MNRVERGRPGGLPITKHRRTVPLRSTAFSVSHAATKSPTPNGRESNPIPDVRSSSPSVAEPEICGGWPAVPFAIARRGSSAKGSRLLSGISSRAHSHLPGAFSGAGQAGSPSSHSVEANDQTLALSRRTRFNRYASSDSTPSESRAAVTGSSHACRRVISNERTWR
jgi:hypothetical protein